MNNLTFEQFNNAEFKLFEGNPIIKNPLESFVIADPSVLTPDISHDGKWHLFCHTFFGVYRYESDNGVDFTNKGKIVNRAMRPNINYINGKYYLFFERTRSVIFNLLSLVGAQWRSEIYCVESTDFKSWSEPYRVIGKTREYEEYNKGYAISNPFLINVDGKYRMYYSCGQTFIDDCGFCEPTHISFAESENVTTGFVSRETPIISPDKTKEYLNLCSGCLKVYKLKDCYIGLQNGLYEKEPAKNAAGEYIYKFSVEGQEGYYDSYQGAKDKVDALEAADETKAYEVNMKIKAAAIQSVNGSNEANWKVANTETWYKELPAKFSE